MEITKEQVCSGSRPGVYTDNEIKAIHSQGVLYGFLAGTVMGVVLGAILLTIILKSLAS